MENPTLMLFWAVSTLLSVLLRLELSLLPLSRLYLSHMPILPMVVLCPHSSTSTEDKPKVTKEQKSKNAETKKVNTKRKWPKDQGS